MSRPLITLGIVLERENFRHYCPIMTSLIVSVLLSLLFWWLNR